MDMVRFADPNEADFPAIDKMRREGKVVSVAFPNTSPQEAGKLAAFIQESIRHGNR